MFGGLSLWILCALQKMQCESEPKSTIKTIKQTIKTSLMTFHPNRFLNFSLEEKLPKRRRNWPAETINKVQIVPQILAEHTQALQNCRLSQLWPMTAATRTHCAQTDVYFCPLFSSSSPVSLGTWQTQMAQTVLILLQANNCRFNELNEILANARHLLRRTSCGVGLKKNDKKNKKTTHCFRRAPINPPNPPTSPSHTPQGHGSGFTWQQRRLIKAALIIF